MPLPFLIEAHVGGLAAGGGGFAGSGGGALGGVLLGHEALGLLSGRNDHGDLLHSGIKSG